MAPSMVHHLEKKTGQMTRKKINEPSSNVSTVDSIPSIHSNSVVISEHAYESSSVSNITNARPIPRDAMTEMTVSEDNDLLPCWPSLEILMARKMMIHLVLMELIFTKVYVTCVTWLLSLRQIIVLLW